MLLVSQPTSKIDLFIRCGPDWYRNAKWEISAGLGLRENPKPGEIRYLRNFTWSTAFLPRIELLHRAIEVSAFGYSRIFSWS